MKYNKQAVEAYLNNDITKLEEYTKKKEPVIMLLGIIQSGHVYNHACSLARISESIFRSWKQRKKAFSAAVRLADAKAIEVAKRKIEDLSDTKSDWRGWAYLLAVKDERYKEKAIVEHEGELVLHIYKPHVENI